MIMSVARIGVDRGREEFRQGLPLVFNYVFFPSVALVVMFFLRGVRLGDSGASLSTYAIPGILAINVVFSGLMGLATILITEREDGTLLRARSLPYGIHAYLIGKLVSQTAITLVTVAVIIAEATLLFGGFVATDLSNLAHLLWILPLGLAATLPFGAALGAAVKNPRNLSFVSLSLMGVVSVSGVLYPLGQQALWMQWLGQATPLYWLGLAFRGGLLGDGAASAEIGGTWRLAETAAVLGVWSIVGTAAAVLVLRRTSRRRGGSRTSRPRHSSPAITPVS